MSTKIDRIKKIKSFLRLQSSPVSVSEIHEALSKRMHLEISRKTIERDMSELIDGITVTVHKGVPSKYVLNKETGFEITLNEDEIRTALQNLEGGSPLYLKLKRCIE